MNKSKHFLFLTRCKSEKKIKADGHINQDKDSDFRKLFEDSSEECCISQAEVI